MLWTSVIVALFVTLPIAAVTSRAFAALYAHAYQRLTSADADVVVLDTSGDQYANDLIHFDDTRQRPILLDAAN